MVAAHVLLSGLTPFLKNPLGDALVPFRILKVSVIFNIILQKGDN